LVTEVGMLVAEAGVAAGIALAALASAWWCAWSPATRVVLFGAFAAGSVMTAVAAASADAVPQVLAATGMLASVLGLARAVTIADAPAESQPLRRAGSWRRRDRWAVFERSFWEHVGHPDSGSRPAPTDRPDDSGPT
jgi:hypothetical protein